MLVMNASNKEQSVRVFGNYFSFKPGQIKLMEDKFGKFLIMNRKYMGFVNLPEKFQDLEYKQSKEGQEEIKKYKESGVKNHIKHLKSLIYNEEVALQQDLDVANIKAASTAFASPRLESAYEEIASYQADESKELAKREEKLKQLRDKVKTIGE